MVAVGFLQRSIDLAGRAQQAAKMLAVGFEVAFEASAVEASAVAFAAFEAFEAACCKAMERMAACLDTRWVLENSQDKLVAAVEVLRSHKDWLEACPFEP